VSSLGVFMVVVEAQCVLLLGSLLGWRCAMIATVGFVVDVLSITVGVLHGLFLVPWWLLLGLLLASSPLSKHYGCYC